MERGKTGEAGNNGQSDQANTAHWSDPLVVLNLALFVAVLIQATIYWKQLREMRSTLAVLTRQASAQEKQTGTMQEELDAIKGQEAVMRDQLVVMKAQGEAQFDIAEISTKAAKESAIYAQRAYVSITSGSVQVAPNGDVLFSLRIENTGNTFARQVKILSIVDVVRKPPTIDQTLPDLPNWATMGLIGPRSFITKLATTRQALTREESELVERRERKLCCWGVIEYVDMFGERRTTKFCFQDSPLGGQFGPYGDDNDAT
ncbi:MAG: hypothetical protein QOH41_414 [Blastocatellia bacterium]|nr:hypothetical protein [Blastocatellia bacterium]